MKHLPPVPISAVAAKASTAYRSRRQRWLADPVAAGSDSLSIALHPPTENRVHEDPDGARAWVRTWLDYAGAGTVEWATRRWPSYGTQEVPIRIELRGAEQIARSAGVGTQWGTLLDRRARLLGSTTDSRAALAVSSTVAKWETLTDTDFDRLLATLTWLLENPHSALLIRQLPIPGVHTKWVGNRRGLLESLLEGFRGSRDLGIRTLPTLADVAVLDRRLLPGAPRVFAASLDELAALPLAPKVVLVLENKECIHALPDRTATMAIHGNGYSVTELISLPWLPRAEVWYRGDLDTHGFAILHRFRHHIRDVRSLMMNPDTLNRWKDLAVPEPKPTGVELTDLTPDEFSAWEMVRAENLRLEQERIPWPYVLGNLERMS
ncbi:hypothetical protein G4H71_20420 [Rhodococcus triatomae]|uniref:DUF3322 and DUF2220 domain-containing protein n=1 Tax=Rhodococcus triatomae TaxID=300028 RepID=A0A1G8SXG3_9NOCA|nr:DUF3322 domain-containing protein [Rhodococcus triatomae]QNG18994.1 hypothetical protein G4H72_09960 [Rhodococcus triatomae]QNG25093.1 hypothetical protein G4H71_20420 [Rhodococcus triatomae]SDJ33873.1 hypothetical protein SAMN05444695_1263 [Rhodococcus triatomae]